MPALVVLGARNLGGAILGHHLNNGWRGAAVAQLAGDARDRPRRGRPAAAGRRVGSGRAARGAGAGARRVRRHRPDRQRGQRGAADASPGRSAAAPLGEASVEDFRGWTGAVAEQAFVFLSEGVRAGASTLIQVTGGSARRAMAGRGLWAAGAAATRALVHAAAQELRADGIHVALLIVDATIDSPKTAAMIAGRAGERERRPGRDRPRRRVPRRPDARAPTRTSSSSRRRETGGCHEL